MRDSFPRPPARYRIQRRLGRGAQGEVFLADDLASGDLRALKVLASAIAHDPVARANFEREFETLVSLRHPYLVSAHDFGYFDDGRLYLSMDFCRGGSLADQKLPLTVQLRDALLADLLEALEFLHLQGLLHLDLKPGNILFDPSTHGSRPRLRLSDFGLMGRVGEKARPAGSLGYVAPEVLEGRPADARADLYAVGAIAFEMTLGRMCFGEDTWERRIARQRAGDWDREALRGDPAILEVLDRLLSPTADVRPADVASLRRVFRPWRREGEVPEDFEGGTLGRDAEQAQLHAWLTQEPPFNVRLVGPPGIGRSALLRALFARLKTGDRRVLLIGPATPNLGRLLASETGIQMLLVDDIHRLGGDALQVLLEWREAHPRAAMCTACDEALLSEVTRAQLRRLTPRAYVLELQALGEPAAEAVISRVLPGLRHPGQRRQLVRASGGRAGALIDLCRALREAGAVRTDASGWHIDEMALERACGQASSDPLAARLSVLSLGTLRYLCACSWLGEDAVRAHLGDFPPPLDPPALLAEPRAWLREPARLRANLACVLPAADREELARVCLGWSGSLPNETRAEVAAAAGNSSAESAALLEAARSSDSADAWRRVIRRLPEGEARLQALDEALAAFDAFGGDPEEEHALRLRLAGPLTGPRTAALNRRLGWALLRKLQVEDARALLELALHQSGADPELRAEALADLGWLHSRSLSDNLTALRLYREGLSLAPPAAPRLRSRLLNRLGVLEWDRGNLDLAEEHLLESIRVARDCGDLGLELTHWNNLSLVMQDEGKLAAVIERGEDLLRRLSQLPASRIKVGSLRYRLGVAYCAAFRYEEAAAEMRRALAWAESRGEAGLFESSLVALALYERLCGRLEEARSLLEERPRTAGGLARMSWLAVRGELACLKGDLAQGERILERVFTFRLRRRANTLAVATLRSLLEAATLARDPALAERWLKAAAEFPQDSLNRRSALALRLAVCGARLVLEGQAAAILAELDSIDEALQATDLEELKVRQDLLRAEAALTLGDLAEAERSLVAVTGRLRDAQAPIEATEAEVLKGLLAARMGQREAALEKLRGARRRASALGLRPLEVAAQRHTEALGRSSPEEGDVNTTQFLIKLAGMINISDSLDELVNNAVDLLLEQLPADRCAVYLLEEGSDRLHLQACRGGGADLKDQARHASETIVRHVLRTGDTFDVPDALLHPELSGRDSVLNFSIRAALCQPLRVSGKVIGTVYLDHSSRSGVFQQSHSDLLHGFCQLLDAMIDKVRTRELLARAREQLVGENLRLRETVVGMAKEQFIVCRSEEMKQVLQRARRAAASGSPVLLRGESGVGKECVATLIHLESPRSHAVFERFNCAAVQSSMMDAEIFGVDPKSATDVAPKAGLFERLDGATLFLDEVAELDLRLQAKLLRVIEDGKVMRVGATRPRKVDVRLISATNRSLEKMVSTGQFREDLYYRLRGLEIVIPPLRDRRADLMPLVDHYLTKLSSEMCIPRPRLAPDLQSFLLSYSWPGNVRELRNRLEQAMVYEEGSMLTLASAGLDDSAGRNQGGRGAAGGNAAGDLAAMLNQVGWNQSEAARILSVSEGTIRYRIKRFGLRQGPAPRGRRPLISGDAENRKDYEDS